MDTVDTCEAAHSLAGRKTPSWIHESLYNASCWLINNSISICAWACWDPISPSPPTTHTHTLHLHFYNLDAASFSQVLSQTVAPLCQSDWFQLVKLFGAVCSSPRHFCIFLLQHMVRHLMATGHNRLQRVHYVSCVHQWLCFCLCSSSREKKV